MASHIVTLTREELYERVWTTPMTTLAKEFGLSDVAIAKRCKAHDIPKPPVGYWAKKAVGKAPARPPLPEASQSDEESIDFWISDDPQPPNPPPPYEWNDKRLEAMAEAARALPPWVVAERLVHPDPLVQRTRLQLDAEITYARARKRRPDVWPEYPVARDVLTLDVSDAVTDRALRLLDALVKRFRACGFEVVGMDREKNKDCSTLVIEGRLHPVPTSRTMQTRPARSDRAGQTLSVVSSTALGLCPERRS
jgi:hypothetical protein